MKCSLGISNFLEEIPSLSHSVVFLYFFALITEEGFLVSSCCSLELCIQMLVSFLFSFVSCLSSFSAICKASSGSHFAFWHFFFLGMVLIPVSYTMSRTSVHSSSGTQENSKEGGLSPVTFICFSRTFPLRFSGIFQLLVTRSPNLYLKTLDHYK